jgi:hypothetical protein
MSVHRVRVGMVLKLEKVRWGKLKWERLGQGRFANSIKKEGASEKRSILSIGPPPRTHNK